MSRHDEQNDFQLTTRSVTDVSASEPSESATSLPPVDRGRGAWTFVLCAFTLDMILWGIPYSFGVLQEYYLSNPPFMKSSEQTINAIGTITVGLMHMQLFIGIPIMMRVHQYKPNAMKTIAWCALGICSVCLVLASFANEAWQLVVLHGVVFGAAAGVLWSPIIIYLSEWFVMRRALAAGIIFGGSSVGGAIFPLILNALLTKTGFRWTLRAMAVILALGCGLSLHFLHPRVPRSLVTRDPSDGRGQSSLFRELYPDFNFLKHPVFATVSATACTQGLAFFTVSLYLPSYAASVGLTPLQGTIALSIFNMCGVIGQVVYGHLCDILPFTAVIIVSGAGGALAAFLMWGFAGNNIALLYTFVIIFGSVGGGFTSVMAPACQEIAGAGSRSGITLGFMSSIRGLSVVIGPAIAAALRSGIQDHSAPKLYGGSGFLAVEIFVGCGMAVTSVGGVLAQIFRERGVRPLSVIND